MPDLRPWLPAIQLAQIATRRSLRTQIRNLAPPPGASAISIATMLLLNNLERNGKPKACATIPGRFSATAPRAEIANDIASSVVSSFYNFESLRRVGGAERWTIVKGFVCGGDFNADDEGAAAGLPYDRGMGEICAARGWCNPRV